MFDCKYDSINPVGDTNYFDFVKLTFVKYIFGYGILSCGSLTKDHKGIETEVYYAQVQEEKQGMF